MSAAPWSKQRCPCLMCGDRHVNCHATCEAYQAWHKERVEARAEMIRQKNRENIANDYQVKEIWKNKRK